MVKNWRLKAFLNSFILGTWSKSGSALVFARMLSVTGTEKAITTEISLSLELFEIKRQTTQIKNISQIMELLITLTVDPLPQTYLSITAIIRKYSPEIPPSKRILSTFSARQVARLWSIYLFDTRKVSKFNISDLSPYSISKTLFIKRLQIDPAF